MIASASLGLRTVTTPALPSQPAVIAAWLPGSSTIGVVRWDRRARQRLFAQIMSGKMRELCGPPRCDVVAALVRVAFNVDDVKTTSVREWCRKTANFLAKAPTHLHLPLMLAIWTGQRQGDLLRLGWSAYDGKHIRLRQSKTGARVVIPVGVPLKSMLEATRRRATVVLVNSEGQPWTSDGFRASWRKACAAAGVVGVTFHDLRGTAVTHLALAGCTDAEIATLTGHSLRDVHAILDAHYLNRDPALAESAVRKLESRTKTPN